jgi:threonine/homoserine/homoserine lactone efflux protein
VTGITLGLAVYMLATIAGAAEGLVRVAWLYEGLRWSGVIYLLWLALETWRGEHDPSPEQADGEPRARSLFFRGLFSNLLNPKAALFYGALLPSFTDPQRGPVALQLLVLGAIHLTLALLVHSTIVFTASGVQPAVRQWKSNGAGVVLRRVFAICLAAVAAWMAWETRRTTGI